MSKDKKVEIKKCSHMGCRDNATWEATSSNGIFYYCEKHKLFFASNENLKMEYKKLE